MKKILYAALILFSTGILYTMAPYYLEVPDNIIATLKEENALCYAEVEATFSPTTNLSSDIQKTLESIIELKKEKKFDWGLFDQDKLTQQKQSLITQLKNIRSTSHVSNIALVAATLQENNIPLIFTSYSVPRPLISALLKANGVDLSFTTAQLPKSYKRIVSLRIHTDTIAYMHNDPIPFACMQQQAGTLIAETLYKKGILSLDTDDDDIDIPDAVEQFREYCNNRRQDRNTSPNGAPYTTSYNILADLVDKPESMESE